MPNYVYKVCKCDGLPAPDTCEVNVPISERDNVRCGTCNEPYQRQIAFTGLTWAPTAGGMR